MKFEKKMLTDKIHEGLLAYRNAPHALTNESPANMFLGRPLRTKISQIQPSTRTTVDNKNRSIFLRKGRAEQDFAVGEKVLTLNYRGDKKWLDGSVVGIKGPRTYLINLRTDMDTSKIVKRHVDQL